MSSYTTWAEAEIYNLLDASLKPEINADAYRVIQQELENKKIVEFAEKVAEFIKNRAGSVKMRITKQEYEDYAAMMVKVLQSRGFEAYRFYSNINNQSEDYVLVVSVPAAKIKEEA
jgi:hypothetical protein